MKKKELNKTISLGIYPFDVMVSFNESNENFVNSLGQFGIDTDDVKLITLASKETKAGRTVMLPNNQTILRLNFYPKTNEDYAMLVHEIFHVTDFVLTRIGIRLSRKSDEAYAYLIQYLTEKIFNLT